MEKQTKNKTIFIIEAKAYNSMPAQIEGYIEKKSDFPKWLSEHNEYRNEDAQECEWDFDLIKVGRH